MEYLNLNRIYMEKKITYKVDTSKNKYHDLFKMTREKEMYVLFTKYTFK